MKSRFPESMFNILLRAACVLAALDLTASTHKYVFEAAAISLKWIRPCVASFAIHS